MRVAETSAAFFILQVDSLHRTVVYTGIAYLAMVEELDAQARYLDVVRWTDFRAEGTAYAIIGHVIVECRVLVQQLRGIFVMEELHLLFELRSDDHFLNFPFGEVGENLADLVIINRFIVIYR